MKHEIRKETADLKRNVIAAKRFMESLQYRLNNRPKNVSTGSGNSSVLRRWAFNLCACGLGGEGGWGYAERQQTD